MRLRPPSVTKLHRGLCLGTRKVISQRQPEAVLGWQKPEVRAEGAAGGGPHIGCLYCLNVAATVGLSWAAQDKGQSEGRTRNEGSGQGREAQFQKANLGLETL